MDASILNLTKLFELTRRYEVPLYQRPYVWGRDTHWEPLWQDVEVVANRIRQGATSPKAHFIGAVVLEQQPRSIAEVETRLVIDGQQRLTTLQLLLEAFADVSKARGMDKVYRRVEKLVRNDEIYVRNDAERFKVWPTAIDQDSFRRVMLHDTAAEVRGAFTSEAEKGIPGAYLFFAATIEEWLDVADGTPAERAEALYRTLREFVRLVVIELSEDDDAQAIFETLNARGEPLRPSDLVKNVLLQRARDEGADVAQAYLGHWKRFDDAKDYWSQELGRGHAARPRIDVFLQHFLTARVREEVAVGHLYAEFRDYLKSSKQSALEHLEELSGYANVYEGFDSYDSGSAFGAFFEKIRTLEVGTAYPWLLEVFRRSGSRAAEVLPALRVLESFLVRRTVCNLSTRGYNRLFLEALDVIDGPIESLADRLTARLLSGKADSNRWPNDAEFKRAWIEDPIYERLRANRVRLILEAIERQLHSKYTEKVVFGETLTIEHLMPREWGTSWPLPEPVSLEARMRRDRALHTIGNLTLLTDRLNPKVSNGPWLEKRPAIDQHCVLMLNRQVANSLVWDEQQILARGETLLSTALALWSRPPDRAGDLEGTPLARAAPANALASPPCLAEPELHPSTAVSIAAGAEMQQDFSDRSTAKKIISDLDGFGLDETRFRLLHHFQPEIQQNWSRLKGFLDYCDKAGRFTAAGTNADTSRRLAACLVALRSGSDWEGAIHIAHERYPAPWTGTVG